MKNKAIIATGTIAIVLGIAVEIFKYAIAVLVLLSVLIYIISTLIQTNA